MVPPISSGAPISDETWIPSSRNPLSISLQLPCDRPNMIQTVTTASISRTRRGYVFAQPYLKELTAWPAWSGETRLVISWDHADPSQPRDIPYNYYLVP